MMSVRWVMKGHMTLTEEFEYDDLKVYPDFERRFNDERRAALRRLYRAV
jgi:hypothetical protein